jgi:hypothetical protein
VMMPEAHRHFMIRGMASAAAEKKDPHPLTNTIVHHSRGDWPRGASISAMPYAPVPDLLAFLAALFARTRQSYN